MLRDTPERRQPTAVNSTQQSERISTYVYTSGLVNKQVAITELFLEQ